MPAGAAHPAGGLVYLLPLVLVALLVARNMRARRLRVEQLWVMPVVFLALAIVVATAQPPPAPASMVMQAAAFLVGGALGWQRGRFTRIMVDPATHALTSRTSPVGMLLILAIFAVRYGLRSFGAETASALHVPVVAITTALMLLAVGLVCVQRLEMALRATRMLKDARAASPAD